MKVQELEVKELQPKVQNKKRSGSWRSRRRRSNPIVILGGKVDLWIAGYLRSQCDFFKDHYTYKYHSV